MYIYLYVCIYIIYIYIYYFDNLLLISLSLIKSYCCTDLAQVLFYSNKNSSSFAFFAFIARFTVIFKCKKKTFF